LVVIDIEEGAGQIRFQRVLHIPGEEGKITVLVEGCSESFTLKIDARNQRWQLALNCVVDPTVPS